jgi:hypothetical protein
LWDVRDEDIAILRNAGFSIAQPQAPWPAPRPFRLSQGSR